MSDFLKMDIFFVIASASVVVISILLAIVLYYVIKVVQTLDRVTTLAEVEARLLKQDLDEARLAAKREGKKITHLIEFALRTGKRLLKGRRTKD